jgi:predicted ATPase
MTVRGDLAEPMYLAILAEAYGAAGEPDEGLHQHDEATCHMDATQERWCEADVHRVRGLLLVAGSDLTAAEASFQQAVAIARRQNAKLWQLRAATNLAKPWREQGKCAEARDLLAPIYKWFTDGFDTPVLQDAKLLLDQLA